MKVLRYSITLCAVALLGILLYNLTSGSGQSAKPLPDMEQIPVFPGAKIIEAVDESRTWRRLTYEVDADIEKVQAYYDAELTQLGWELIERSAYFPSAASYSLTDLQPSAPWNLRLDVSLADAGTRGTNVVLIFGRYPPVADELPVYEDADDVEIAYTHGEKQPWYISPPLVTTKTYLTKASLDDIERYYNSILPERGWIFFETADKGGRGPVDTQTGSIHSEEGLFFVARKPGSTNATTRGAYLFVTAHQDQNGETKVQLKATEDEMKISP